MTQVSVTTPSRLHFGLWSLAGASGRQFGGVGAMIDKPSLRLSVEEAAAFQIFGPSAERAAAVARRWADHHARQLPASRLTILESIPEHAGLGSGTQLALGIAAALSAFVGLAEQTPEELAVSVGRGRRSAVGTYGFFYGGLIVEQGKQPREGISPIHCRVDLPEDWRFVLVKPQGLAGLAGVGEVTAFERLPPIPSAITEELQDLARGRLVPAAVGSDFPAFSQALYRYGRLSGECFAGHQGGPYNGPIVTALVEQLLEHGPAGVGQSSWGPTVYIATQSQDAADRLLAMVEALGQPALDAWITSPNNQGARLQVQ